ncbi:phosphoribosylamine--glycine ligase [Aurantimonas sp. Leaf443]|uniref:phosphoribosylamine--glycine ligase n=1 Tax=Aurantimonas sp. Leaf443 TaxID=1736378 RepID=UPI0006F71D8A|nr:phosphoribosylamine--glycine ligase [Aurantimonas sp. Leaf443]KQT88046.1 phosphoribosylamine--glycine ligase [Aurantimonas sp. Leaf443]
MNILLIGSGGREHALAWKLSQSPELGRLFAAPGNPGIAEHAECVALDVSDHEAVAAFCRRNEVSLVVVGPEVPLVAGLADDLRAAGLLVFGPSAAAARLEGSKGFTKDLCTLKDIPTAGYGRFAEREAARDYVERMGAPIVVKADGLAAGKGVTVAATLEEALEAVDAIFEGAPAGAEIVVEEFLEGEEASLFCLCDGEGAVVFGTAQDHKRVFDGDEGPNTGGMGAYSPAVPMDEETTARAMREIVVPTLAGMAEAGTPFSGVLYAGLMLTRDGPKLIEYNVRFGDPECQVLMMRLTDDLLPILLACARGDVSQVAPTWTREPALTVVMAAKGYPGTPARGGAIALPAEPEGTKIFHAGTARRGDALVADGGRVLNVTALGSTVREAAARAYGLVAQVDWADGFNRTDIGHRAIAAEGKAR